MHAMIRARVHLAVTPAVSQCMPVNVPPPVDYKQTFDSQPQANRKPQHSACCGVYGPFHSVLSFSLHFVTFARRYYYVFAESGQLCRLVLNFLLNQFRVRMDPESS
ncbi:hypothetical protein DUNSADRAFT_708 [Dunaliella salina]|uniref:Encoded protein n=1 Tax=Dunaliella salina TaxID=3046 RepID=A0ABQ7FYF6_DUNSA|nr:hypothetical protein DUNSADRAFT_708 [Dunaliella salina]|eukprot:KAF5827409.1 hypothetical protein DUNSADRAFT_708 [Dunaliella salina]